MLIMCCCSPTFPTSLRYDTYVGTRIIVPTQVTDYVIFYYYKTCISYTVNYARRRD